MTKKIQINYLL